MEISWKKKTFVGIQKNVGAWGSWEVGEGSGGKEGGKTLVSMQNK